MNIRDCRNMSVNSQRMKSVRKKNGEFTVDFSGLKELNPDCIGWIRFENIDISYPIMQGEDNEYYLKHTFEDRL